MRRSPFTAGVCALALALTVVGAGCGDDDEEDSAKPTAAEPAAVDPNKDPYSVTCAEVADVQGSAELMRRAQFALADDAKLKDMSRQHAARSIYYAMTELCKDMPSDATPAREAVKAVERGQYIAR